MFPNIVSAHFLSSIDERAVGYEAAQLYENKNRTSEYELLTRIQKLLIADNPSELNFNDGKKMRYLSNVKLSYEDTINGFSFPGGYTYITYKMLTFAGFNSDEDYYSAAVRRSSILAFVMAHEFGHYVNEDYLRKIDQKYNQQILFSLFSGYGSPNQTTIENLSRDLIYNQSSRDLSFRTEKEADEKGMDLLKNDKNLSIGGSILFFKKLQALENKNKQFYKRNSSNPHSDTELRLERSFEYISKLSNNNITFKNDKVFLYNKEFPGNIDDAYCISGLIAAAIGWGGFYQNNLYVLPSGIGREGRDLSVLVCSDGKKVTILYACDFSREDYKEKNENYLNSSSKNIVDFIVNSAPKKKLY